MVSPGKSIPLIAGVGLSFLVVGSALLLALNSLELTAEAALAAALFAWGVIGMGFAVSMRPAPEWSTAIAGFGALAAIAAVFILFLDLSIEWLALLSILGFLCEGVFSATYGLRLQANGQRGATLLLTSGGVALILGLVVLWVWPEMRGRLLELLLGLDFEKAGLSFLMITLLHDRAGE